MAMDMLRRLAASPLPANFHAAEEIDKVKLLRAAGLVIARSPPAANSSGTADSAQVLAITAKGREELARFDLPCRSGTFTPEAANSWKSRLRSDFLARFLQ